MKCHPVFRKKISYITNLSSAELAKRVIKVNLFYMFLCNVSRPLCELKYFLLLRFFFFCLNVVTNGS